MRVERACGIARNHANPILQVGVETAAHLAGIAARKERDYLVESLVDPQAAIAEGYQAEISPMPPMKVLLAPQEFADVLAYLMTLK